MQPAPHRFTNEEIADQLEEAAELLHAHDADTYRVRAYRRAATYTRTLGESAIDILDREGRDALVALPTIGRSIAASIEEMAWSGRWALLDRLRGEVTPEELFMTLPGVGEALASRMHTSLHVDTLEELELAAHDGRLEQVEGIGPRRLRAIRDLLAVQLRRSTRRFARRVRDHEHPTSFPETSPEKKQPSVALLLELDREYRDRASLGDLRMITPRRFNEDREPRLPIWHADAKGWCFTVLFSNSAMAHRLDKTGDWVVLFWEQDGHEDQATVVTEYQGPMNGRRVVRGRERECLAHWARVTEWAARARPLDRM